LEEYGSFVKVPIIPLLRKINCSS